MVQNLSTVQGKNVNLGGGRWPKGTNSYHRNLWMTPVWKYLKSWKQLTNLLVKVHATFISYLNFFLKIQTKYGMANCQFANSKCSMSVRKKRSTDSKKYLLGKPLESSKKVSKAELHCFRWWFLLKWRFSCCPSTLLSSHYSQNPKILPEYLKLFFSNKQKQGLS